MTTKTKERNEGRVKEGRNKGIKEGKIKKHNLITGPVSDIFDCNTHAIRDRWQRTS